MVALSTGACNRRGVVAGLVALALASPVARARVCRAPSVVMVLPVLHRLHAGNAHYGYADIDAIVAGFRPDRVGVEIRAEDMGRDHAYLAANYPREMIKLADDYGPRAFGFDWLGDDLAGRAIPPGWWKSGSSIKAMERDLDAHPVDGTPVQHALNARIDRLQARQQAMMTQASAARLAGGRYDRVTADYYRAVHQLLDGTRFAPLPAFYTRRDAEIAAAVVAAVRAAPGKRIAIVTGCDHHGPVIRALRAAGGCIVVAPVTARP
jgi:hypothetical protein